MSQGEPNIENVTNSAVEWQEEEEDGEEEVDFFLLLVVENHGPMKHINIPVGCKTVGKERLSETLNML